MPRTSETSAGLLHASGIPNPGLELFLSHTLPALRLMGIPIIVNILGQNMAEWSELARRLGNTGSIAAIELNLTPPQLIMAEQVRQPLPAEPELHSLTADAISTVKNSCSLPLIAKLPSSGAEIGALASTAESAGADILSIGQSFPGIAVRPNERRFRFQGVVGGLSGPAIKPMALYQVWRVKQAASLPVIASGGIMTAEDAIEFFIAGADAAAIGVGLSIHPSLAGDISIEITRYLAKHQIKDVRALRAS